MASLIQNLFKSRQKRNYGIRSSVMDNRKNLGNDYTNNILKKSISPYITRNARMNDFVILIQKVLSDLVDAVTYLKGFKSYTTKKDYKNFR